MGMTLSTFQCMLEKIIHFGQSVYLYVNMVKEAEGKYQALLKTCTSAPVSVHFPILWVNCCCYLMQGYFYQSVIF